MLSRRQFLRGSGVAFAASLWPTNLKSISASAASLSAMSLIHLLSADVLEGPQVPIVALASGLSEQAGIYDAWLPLLSDVTWIGGAAPLAYTPFWAFFADIDSADKSVDGVTITLTPSARSTMVAISTSDYYPVDYWDLPPQILTLPLPGGGSYEQAFPGYYGADLPSITTNFSFTSAIDGSLLGTISYSLPAGDVKSSFPDLVPVPTPTPVPSQTPSPTPFA
jgi:hypothetical protein